MTASSTMAVRMCGGETSASTPHCSVNSHSFFGWFTRASTRGTANSCFASSDVTRLSSSSPVAATSTSALGGLGALEHPRLARVAEHHPHLRGPGPQLLDEAAVLLDQRDLVPALGEVDREVPPDRAAAGDDDLHQWCSPGGSKTSSSVSMPSFVSITTR